MSNVGYNILVLAFCWMMATGAGVYYTFFKQPEELDRLAKAEELLQIEQKNLTSLVAEEAGLREQARMITAKWNARYKVMPQELASPDVIGFMNELTQRGFENFDIVFEGERRTGDFRYHAFSISGRGYFDSLYRFVWQMENSRYLYRIQDLSLDHLDLITEDRRTKKRDLKVMVSFRIVLHAYFDGVDGLSAPPAGLALLEAEAAKELPATPEKGDRPDVPAHVLPRMRPAMNPFRPVIADKLPPNSDNLVEVDHATLVSIVGDQAIVDWDGDFVPLRVGDPVYLGKVVSIDPHQERLLARLNRGGIYDEVELELETGEERYRQALGPLRLAPTGSQ